MGGRSCTSTLDHLFILKLIIQKKFLSKSVIEDVDVWDDFSIETVKHLINWWHNHFECFYCTLFRPWEVFLEWAEWWYISKIFIIPKNLWRKFITTESYLKCWSKKSCELGNQNYLCHNEIVVNDLCLQRFVLWKFLPMKYPSVFACSFKEM